MAEKIRVQETQIEELTQEIQKLLIKNWELEAQFSIFSKDPDTFIKHQNACF